ncbi:STM4504/CBY_0614 family protein [Massilia sp. BKSP1R2A-1]|uniref:STM4504/CBY_0614 family protein n=1 Tax=Massilia sp. BKSP1R2A-1 TaxID=3422595 RepID=UPI003D342E93
MSPVALFSRRQSDERGLSNDVLRYDEMPEPLRVQIVHIFNDVLGSETDYDRRVSVQNAYGAIVATLRREYGVFELPPSTRRRRNTITELREFILHEFNVEHVLDAVELACRVISVHSRDHSYLGRYDGPSRAVSALDELNLRFKQHAVGYRYDVPSKQVVRIDSELIHSEVIKPALALLADPAYRGVQEEFLSAYEHYRHQRPKEALVDALKSLESMAKTIAQKHHWEYSAKATAKHLFDLLFEKELIPPMWASQYTGLRSMLESGVPTARNRLSGHGQGSEVVDVPDHFVAFALHQTAAAIVFLADAERAL